MAYTDIDKSDDYFNTVLYTGNGTADRTVTGVGFQPQLLWIKERSNVSTHSLTDIVRGASKRLQSSGTDAEFDTGTDNVRSFDSDGFTLGTGGQVNENTQTYVSWNWLANGVGVSNTDGTATSTVSASTTSGFSIVSYTGTGATATVGHGIDTPKMIIIKNRDDGTGHWRVYHASIGATKAADLDNTGAFATRSSTFNDTAPTSSVFSIGSDSRANGSGNSMIAYCFAEKKGFSKAFSYTGNGSADGSFCYLGFKPAFVLLKANDLAGWEIADNKRTSSGGNVIDKELKPNDSGAETTNNYIDFLSNGFKIRNAFGNWNGSGVTYIGIAFAENPLVSSAGVPCTAR